MRDLKDSEEVVVSRDYKSLWSQQSVGFRI